MCLITFEGIDGSGKSTQAVRLRAHLRAQGHAPLLVRDPGGTDLSERIRHLVLDAEHTVDPMAELMLFCAARAQLVAEEIRPALQQGRIVLCDRFYDSTTAYQGGGRGVADVAWLDDLHRHVTGGLVPDRTYWVALDTETATARRRDGTTDAETAGAETAGAETTDDRMEAAGASFQERVASAYANLAARHPERILRLDGTQSIEAVQAHIQSDVQRLLSARSAPSPEA